MGLAIGILSKDVLEETSPSMELCGYHQLQETPLPILSAQARRDLPVPRPEL